MTTKTRAELVTMASDELLISSSGNSPDADDFDKVNARVDGLFAELASRGICEIADEDEIPVEWTGPLSELLANECANIFGRPKKAALDREMIEDRLRVMVNRIAPVRNTLRTDNALQPRRGFYTVAQWTRGN